MNWNIYVILLAFLGVLSTKGNINTAYNYNTLGYGEYHLINETTAEPVLHSSTYADYIDLEVDQVTTAYNATDFAQEQVIYTNNENALAIEQVIAETNATDLSQEQVICDNNGSAMAIEHVTCMVIKHNDQLDYLLTKLEYIERSMETMKQRHEEKEKSLEIVLLKILEKLNLSTTTPSPISVVTEQTTETPPAPVHCSEECMHNFDCTSAFWTNSTNSECVMNYKNESVNIAFTPGEIFYCKECETTTDSVFAGEDAGVIKMVNVALNQPTEISSAMVLESAPSMAIDGNINTEFKLTSLTNESPWLMIDLGQRYLVAQIRIFIKKNTLLNKIQGGYFKVCLVDNFDRNTDPCKKDNEILTINKRLSSTFSLFDVKKVMMGRYIVLKKIENKKIIQFADIDIQGIVPTLPWKCERCDVHNNTFCDKSSRTSSCECSEYDQYPIDSNALKGCTDPCLGFNMENAVCSPIDFETYTCSCMEGSFYPIGGDPCNGCLDPCVGFNIENSVCIPKDFESYNCSCQDGPYRPIEEHTCRGCKNPCLNVKERNFDCLPIDFENYDCSCRKGYFPIFESACVGCRDPCSGFRAKNAECLSIDSENYDCRCKKNFIPAILDDACLGCH